jgi:hypothetical protein
VRADFENRGMAILRLCAARLGQDIGGEPRRTVVYMRTAIIQVFFLSPETEQGRGSSATRYHFREHPSYIWSKFP